jgi:hypothetical protein
MASASADAIDPMDVSYGFYVNGNSVDDLTDNERP